MQLNTAKLGEGAQGCVLRGTLAFSTNTNNNVKYIQEQNKYLHVHKEALANVGQVTKIIIDEVEFQNEIDKTRLANKIDKGQYSMPFVAYSRLGQSDIQAIMDDNHLVLQKMNLCDNVKRVINNIKALFQIIYKYEGISLYSIQVSAIEMLQLCYNLYEGLKLYNSKQFLHFDVKDDNVIYIKDNNIGKAVFIDFGKACFIKNIPLNEHASMIIEKYKNYFLYEPPELIAFAVLKYGRQRRESQEIMMEKFKLIYEHNLIARNIAKKFKYTYKDRIINNIYGDEKAYNDALEKYFMSLYNMSEDGLLNHIKQHIPYIDIYKLSLTMFDILDYHNYHKYNTSDADLITSFYLTVVCKALIIDPAQRTPIGELLKHYQELLATYAQSRATPQQRRKTV